MGINDKIRDLWKQGYFFACKSSTEVKLNLYKTYGITCTNISSQLNSCKSFLRKTKAGWIQKTNYSDVALSSKKQNNYFVLLNIHPEIKKVSEKLFSDTHYAPSILEAFKRINNLVKIKSGRSDLDGKSLMLTVFSLNNPILKFNDLVSQSDKDEQEGFMHLFAGAMLGIRNPKAHENIVQKDKYKALEYLVFASLLCRRLDETKKMGLD